MAERRSLWPLLVYGALVAIAAARRRQTEETRGSESRGVRCEFDPAAHPAPDESGEARGELRPATEAEPDKRPREQFENDQPVSDPEAPGEGGGARTTREGSLGNALGGLEGYLLAHLREHQ